MQADVIHLRGCLEIALLNAKTGEIVEKIRQDNTIVTAGRVWVLQQIESSDMVTSQSISYLGVGTGTAAPATSDTGLASEITRIAVASFATANFTSNPPSWQAQASFATNVGNSTLGEMALFNSSANGTMLGRATFATINKTTSNTLSVSYTVSN